MARYNGPVCRLCRRENTKLMLKGDRCYSDKCSIDRRPYPPGMHGQARKKNSEYSIQLREKQKVRRIYGVDEKQFRKYFKEADRLTGITGENLLILLEKRLDNVVYRLGFAASRAEARIMVRHNHILVNGSRLNIPSYLVGVGQTVEIREKSHTHPRVVDSMTAIERRGVPRWLEVDKAGFKGVLNEAPVREELTMPMNEQLIVELYSK